jgi:hypothetical protein
MGESCSDQRNIRIDSCFLGTTSALPMAGNREHHGTFQYGAKSVLPDQRKQTDQSSSLVGHSTGWSVRQIGFNIRR